MEIDMVLTIQNMRLFSTFMIVYRENHGIALTNVLFPSKIVPFLKLGYSQAVRHQTLNLAFPWFESKYPSHMITKAFKKKAFFVALI